MRQIPSVSQFTFAIMFLLAPPLQGQTVYRCANAYSQTPCPGAVLISVDDSRSPAQKAQTDAAAAQAARSADKLEKDRLARERAAAGTAAPRPARADVVLRKPSARKKEPVPGPFTAYAPPPEKIVEKKPSAKSTPP